MANTYFFTGFPGFISSQLIREIVKNQEISKIYLLVLPQLVKKAEEDLGDMASEMTIRRDQLQIISGDITKEGLNLSVNDQEKIQNEITHVFHLAAIYDLAVPKDIAYKVNVIGTGHMNNWVQTLSKLKRYIYFSTAYVSGKREGKIFETDLNKGQTFKNHYEETKFEAELLVDSIKKHIPTTIIRPGVVCGDSRTGETIKFDGPYFMLNLFNSLKKSPIIPYFGKSNAKGNFVPIDYVIKATNYLAHSDIGIGKTYHLTDPNPYQMKEVYSMLMHEFLGKKPVGTIPIGLAKQGLSFKFVRRWLKTEKESLEYTHLMADYDCTQAINDLKDSGITCPNFKRVVPAMVNFYRKHKDDSKYHIKIN